MKRSIAVLLALCLAVSLCVVPVRAAEIIFIAVNDTIPNALNEAAMPFYQDGSLYIPYTIFNNSALGVVPAYDTTERTLTLSDSAHTLVYDILGGSVTEDSFLMKQQSILVRYGILFVPLDYTAGFFGISVSYLTSQGGYAVVRLKTGAEVYGDALFVEKAENLIAYRIEQYHPAIDPDPQPGEQTDPQPGEEQDPEPPEDESPEQVYTALAVSGISKTLLNDLDRHREYAAIFLTASELAENRDLIRRAVGSGHRIGVDVRAAEEPLTEITAFNEELDMILCIRTMLVLCRDEQMSELEHYFAYPAPETEGELLLLDAKEAAAALEALRGEGNLPDALQETTPLPLPLPKEPEASPAEREIVS